MDTVDADLIAELEELVAASEDPEGFYTAEEWADAAGMSVPRMRRKLGVVKDAGRLGMADVRRERLDGQPYTATAYRILPA